MKKIDKQNKEKKKKNKQVSKGRIVVHLGFVGDNTNLCYLARLSIALEDKWRPNTSHYPRGYKALGYGYDIYPRITIKPHEILYRGGPFELQVRR